MIGIMLISTIIFSTISIAEDKEKEDVLDGTDIYYDFALVILDCDCISGLPEDEYVGLLQDLEMNINGFTQGIIITLPDADTVIIDGEESIQIIIGNFFGTTHFYSSGSGKIFGIASSIEWK